jgi:hypothetical protein
VSLSPTSTPSPFWQVGARSVLLEGSLMEEHSILQPGSVLPPTRRVPSGGWTCAVCVKAHECAVCVWGGGGGIACELGMSSDLCFACLDKDLLCMS